MSTMRADTLANSAGTGSPAIVGGELSRARWEINGTGVTGIQDSFNVSSLIDLGVGDYRVSYTISMPSPYYTPVMTAGSVGCFIFGKTANSVDQRCLNTSMVVTDPTIVAGAIFGDRP